ncbi:MAG: hypothetical protein MUF18_14915 [Fimbriiglobus sp.]|jgi:hypothetical protein|nr:hypothetical protein [Fimbriiglobus sp.]
MPRLLAVLLLVAVAPVASAQADPKAEREAAKYVAEAGGIVIRDEDPNSKLRGVVITVKLPPDAAKFELKRLAVFPKLATLSLSGVKNADAALKQLADLPGISTITLEDSDCTDAGLTAVAALPGLKRLDVSRAKLTPAGFKALAASKTLERLDATGTAIDDVSIKELGKVKTLAELILKETKVTLVGTGSAFAGWEKLTLLDLSDTAAANKALEPVGVAKNLEVLNLTGAEVTDVGLRPLAGCKKLKVLTLEGAKNITGSGFADLDTLTQLDKLYLGGSGVTDAGLGAIARRTSVKTLSLERTKVTDAGVKELGTPRALETLGLEETAVSDVGLLVMAEKCKKLTLVNARKSKITAKGAADAGKKLPELVVSFD